VKFELLSRHLKGKGIRFIFTSPLRRAVQTAEILARNLELSVVIERELREIVLGPLEGLSHEQVKARFPEVWKAWTKTPGDLRLEGMEPLEEVQKRILSLMMRWHLNHENETFAAVTHMAVLRCTLLRSMGRPLNDYRKIDVPNATAFVFEANEKKSDDCLNLKLVKEVHAV